MNRAADQPEPNPLREGLSARPVPQPCNIVIFGATPASAGLAITDDVDTDHALARDNLAHRVADAGRQRARVDRLAFLLRVHELDQAVGARQAAGMSRQDPVDAAFHMAPEPCADQYVARPPLASKHCDVTKLASSDARNCTTAATSSAVPKRPIGALLNMICVAVSGS